VANFEEEIYEKKLNLQYSGSEENSEINFDCDSLEKIVSNLLSNAIRYTQSLGDINVKLTIEVKIFIIIIEDRGIGIKPEEKRNIFQEFYRSPQAKELEHLSTGLGLPLVKRKI